MLRVSTSARLSWTHYRHFCRASSVRPLAMTSSSSPTTAWYSSETLKGVDERAGAILDYWLSPGYATGSADWVPPEEYQKKWFGGGAKVDQEVNEQFRQDVESAAAGKYDAWLKHPLNALAGIILLDQFTRNIYRGSAQAFAADAKAIAWAREMVANGLCDQIHPATRQFVYLPYMHQEDLHTQEDCVRLFNEALEHTKSAGWSNAAGHLNWYPNFAVQHRDVVKEWGRFPHRNGLLGRENTPEEEAGLAAGTIKKFG